MTETDSSQLATACELCGGDEHVRVVTVACIHEHLETVRVCLPCGCQYAAGVLSCRVCHFPAHLLHVPGAAP